MATWRCIKHCGACCHLDPAERPGIETYLAPDEFLLYLTLVGEGGWCIHFDRTERKCRIYERRPHFCRVAPEILEQMNGIPRAEFDSFAINCCRQQIAGVYGENSPEMRQYNREVGK